MNFVIRRLKKFHLLITLLDFEVSVVDRICKTKPIVTNLMKSLRFALGAIQIVTL